MKYKILRTISTCLLVVLMPLTTLSYFSGTVGKDGVLNGLNAALIEIEDLEKRNLLHSPPEGTSRVALREISLVHNSEGLRQYIREVEEGKSEVIAAGILTALTIATYMARRHFKKRVGEEELLSTKKIGG